MHIELLWVIPIISFAVFLFIVTYNAQKSAERRSKTGALFREVALFNSGQELPGVARAERNLDRLQDLEKAINLVTEVLARQGRSAQEPPVDPAGNSPVPGSGEVNELKEKLRSVFKEYDIIISENYTLRAKVKQLSKLIKEQESPVAASDPPQDRLQSGTPASPKSTAHLYDDTRLINLAGMDLGEKPASSESDPAL
jgi:hypothetical protein